MQSQIACGYAGAAAVAIFPGDKRVAIGTKEGNVDVWCCRTGKCTMQIRAASSPIRVLLIFPDGTKVLTAGANDKTVGIWNVEDIQLVGFESPVDCAAVS